MGKFFDVYRFQLPLFDKNGILTALYLSVVTITTLGFGDIVPVNDYARLWISLESIIGLVLMGLFIFSITTTKKKSSETKKRHNFISYSKNKFRKH